MHTTIMSAETETGASPLPGIESAESKERTVEEEKAAEEEKTIEEEKTAVTEDDVKASEESAVEEDERKGTEEVEQEKTDNEDQEQTENRENEEEKEDKDGLDETTVTEAENGSGKGKEKQEDMPEIPTEENDIENEKNQDKEEIQDGEIPETVTEGTQDDEGIVNEDEGVVVSNQEGVVGIESHDSHVTPSSRAPLENIIEEEEEEEEEVEAVDRNELIANCQEALKRQEKLKRENAQLQHKIAEYLSHKKEEKADPGRNVTDQEKTYHQCMSALDRLELEMEENRAEWIEKEEEVRDMCARMQAEVQEKTEEFLKYQESGARQAVDSHSGHRLLDTELKRLQTAQYTSDQSVFQARLENIKMSNKIERMEQLLKQKEELAEGLHMLDFEQLKISNMDLGEKVEERNEDIRKLSDKITDTVQVLTHVKEKLNFLQDESEEKKELLGQLDFDLARRREVLTRLKQSRDSLRLDNQRLRQRGGLVSHTQLLRDFEDRQDENAELQKRLEELQTQHSHTSVQCAGLRRKIDQTTSNITQHHRHHIH